LCEAYELDNLVEFPEALARMEVETVAQLSRQSAAGDSDFQGYWAAGQAVSFYSGLFGWLSEMRSSLEAALES